jgi:hypothetical protein
MENKSLKDEIRTQVDPADLERRNRQESVIKEIMARAKKRRFQDKRKLRAGFGT